MLNRMDQWSGQRLHVKQIFITHTGPGFVPSGHGAGLSLSPKPLGIPGFLHAIMRIAMETGRSVVVFRSGAGSELDLERTSLPRGGAGRPTV